MRGYKALGKAIANDEHEKASELMQQLNVKNLYEDAIYHVARFQFADKWGNKESQLYALRRAIANEDDAKYLPSATFRTVLQRLATLQLEAGHYAEALVTVQRLLDKRRKLSVERRAAFQEVEGRLLAIRDAQTPMVRKGQVGSNNYYWLQLWRDSFTVQVLSGEVAELKLRCGKGYVFFRFDPQLKYTAPNSDKSCSLQVVGNPGSELRVLQQ